MLAALLCNEPLPGGVAKDEAHERAERALENLRREHFERQAAGDIDAAAEIEVKIEAARKRYKLPVLPEIEELQLGEPATLGDGVGDDELALLFIIAEA